jgi:inosine-uridine nucleoside N-ribohydrolase
MNPSNTLLRRYLAARKALIILLIFAAVMVLALLPSAFAATQADWQINEVAQSLGGFSYESLIALAAGVRLALAGLFLVTAALLLSYKPQAGSLLAALTLITLPFAFSLAGAAQATAYASPWNTLLRAAAQVLSFTGLGAFLLLIYLFPDGRFFPTWLRLPALVSVGVIIAGMVALQFVDSAWAVFILGLLLMILVGVVGQFRRYQAADLEQRRQTIGFLIALLAILGYLLITMSSALPLLSLVAGYFVLALLPIGLLLAARRGAWGEARTDRLQWVFTGAMAVTVVVTAFTTIRWWRDNQPVAIDMAALATGDPVPVLLDADMAMDDIGALFFLLQHPAVDLRAITVNGVAFAHCDPGVRNTLGMLEVARAPQIPVSCGREDAYPGGHPAPAAWRKSADNLYGARVTTGERQPDPRPAAVLLADTVNAAPGAIVVLAIGPLTNLAEAFQADPALPGRIKEIVIMGGAVDAPGNVADEAEGITNRYAEWNFFADPLAADIVLASGTPITLVPLDATNDVPMRRGFYEQLRANMDSRPATFIYNLMYMNQWWLDGGMFWWDTLAAAAVLEPGLLSLRESRLDIVTQEGPEMGRVIEFDGGVPVRLAINADAQRFEALFLAVLNSE